ncbi:hydroxyacylglutathione hydrolase [Halobacteriales archaeon QS_3_64_16]|nr:MAG: hydroxyacylglutathione hydrolase [Halobacteriales archaeon QS_3_64_16]
MDDADPIGADRSVTTGIGIDDVHRIEFDVDWPPGHVAAYLLETPELTLIDAGMTGERAGDRLEEALDTAGYDLADVAHLLVTHPHVDHVGQVPRVIERADPTVYAPVGVRERLAREPDDLERQVEANATAAGLGGAERDGAIGMARDSLERSRRLLPPAAVDRWVGEDGSDSVTVGELEFETIPTPGHQADHHCFETTIEGERVLFAGDTVLEPFRPVLLHIGLDRGVEQSLPAFERTLDRLGARSIDRAFPGHGPVHEEHQETIDRDRRSLRRLTEGVASRLDPENGTTAAELARERVEDEREFAYRLPEVVSALARLEATDRARRSTTEAGVQRYRPASVE